MHGPSSAARARAAAVYGALSGSRGRRDRVLARERLRAIIDRQRLLEERLF